FALFFFFQAEDGIRDFHVTGVQTCALPICSTVGPGEEVTYTIRAADFEGNPVDAEVSLALVDLATLSLVQPNSGPIAEHFYGDRSEERRVGKERRITRSADL